MKRIAKKVIIYSMIGLTQIGLLANIAEASPLRIGEAQRAIQVNEHDRGRDDERRHQHDERKRQENERHEREMKRRPHESEREWRERQEREKERHENALREIAALLIGIAIGSSNE